METNIHPSAFIHPGARLGEGVSVGQCALIEDNVEIGDNSRIAPFASVKQYTRMGRNNIIHSYAMVGAIPQDLKFRGEESWLEMGDGNNIREFASLHRGSAAGGGVTRIGSGNLIMAYAHIAHDCILGDGVIMSNNATLAGHVLVDDGAILGGLAAVHQFSRIGKHAFLGGMSGAVQDIPPYMLAVGPRAELHGPNLVGLRRKGMSRGDLAALKGAYRLIWLSATPRQEALEQAEELYREHAPVLELIEFIRSSTRGITPASGSSDKGEEENA